MDISKRFETLRFLKSPIKTVLLEALEYVKHFIIKKKLILVGGMAIDCNLRLKNLKLYDDDQIPDYDCYSPESADDAYLLGHELCEKRFPNVDVITAIHTTSMRVRVDGNVVADITYMPRGVFDRLRTQEYQGMKVLHPFYTMMDQFRSLSCPYENPPNEVLSQRWSKDVERFNMLVRAYPLDDKAPEMPAIHTVRVPDLKTAVLGGWGALAYHLQKQGVQSKLSWTAQQIGIPVDRVTLMTHDISSWRSKDARYFNALFSYPRHIRTKGAEIFDFWGERMTVSDDNPKIASIASCMFYFLHTWLLRGDPISLIGVQLIRDLLLKKPLHLDITPLGRESWNVSSQYSIANILNYDRVKNWKPQMQNFAESDCKIKRSFDIGSSPLFAIDESETSEWTDIVPREALLININKT